VALGAGVLQLGLRHSCCSARPSLRFVVVAVTQVAYEVEGWGVGELVVADERVVWHELPWPRAHRPAREETPRPQNPSQTPTHPGAGAGAVVSRTASSGDRGFVTEVLQMLRAYFAGEQVPLETVPVDLDYRTPFLTRCAAALRTIPRGEVVTYGELAALAGAPGAARAAGSFCAHSHLSIFVPCHRVVSAAGLGPYGSYGTGYKRRLLDLEGYELAAK
jgi:methylated-DNA-[protein]-cysteine S-methyltransferase